MKEYIKAEIEIFELMPEDEILTVSTGTIVNPLVEDNKGTWSPIF